jgi:hypothetical protein
MSTSCQLSADIRREECTSSDDNSNIGLNDKADDDAASRVRIFFWRRKMMIFFAHQYRNSLATIGSHPPLLVVEGVVLPPIPSIAVMAYS